MNKEEIIKSTLDYIEQQLTGEGEGLALDVIAAEIGYSKFYLNRVFQDHMKTTIHQYILERSLTEAARKLVYTEKSIVDIAYEAGYQSQQAFTNAFRGGYLCTPMKYRCDQQYFPLRKPYQMRHALFSTSQTLAVAA